MRLEIKKLYGRFDYEFDFDNKGVTIITGPNGYGKSTILHCMQAMNNSNIYFFLNLEFQEIKVSSNEHTVEIKKTEDTMYVNGHPYQYKYTYKYDDTGTFYDHPINNDIRILQANDDNKELDLQSMAKIAENVKLINEQRLVREASWNEVSPRGRIRGRDIENIKVVEDIPGKLSKYIDQTAGIYTEVATRLDSTFPYRILENKPHGMLNEEKFNDLYKNMNDKLEMLSKMGILEKKEDRTLRFNPDDAKVFEIFFSDFDAKYKVYEPLLKKMSLFLDILNNRFTFKKVKISENQELMIIDEETNKSISLGALSSGEQEIIILFYSLIFETKENTIVLIDEPEISLHIAWQMMFIDDLRKIVELNHLTAVVATHSPDIIGGNRDIQIDLGEMYEDGLDNASVM